MRAGLIGLLVGLLVGAGLYEPLVRSARAEGKGQASERAQQSREEAAKLLHELDEVQQRLSQHEERLRQLGDAALDCKLGWAEQRLKRRVASLP